MPGGDRKLTMEELGLTHANHGAGTAKRRIRVILEDVRSRHNVGSVFRTADAFGVEGVVLCGHTPQPPHREIEKTALGATLFVPWVHAEDAAAEVHKARSEGFQVLAVEQTLRARALGNDMGSEDHPIALVFGNELNGVSQDVIEACDGCVVIPQHGTKHSLNISVCAGVVLWYYTKEYGYER